MPVSTVEYHTLPRPFMDIAVIQTVTAQEIDIIFQALKSNLSPLGLSVYLLPAMNCVIICDSALSIDSQQNQTLFSGMGIIDDQFYCGPQTLDLMPEVNLGECVGLFTAISLCDDEILADQDFLGQGHYYYYSWFGGSFITNRSHLAAVILAEAALPARPNRLFIHTLLLDHPFFSHQPFTHETPIQSLKRLPLNYDASIRNGRLTLREKKEWNEVFSGEGDYKKHLLQAQYEVSNNLEKVINSNNFDIIACELSGGKDSRMMISHLVNNSRLKEKIQICTRNVPKSDDLEIACKIIENFNLELHCNDQIPIKPISLNTALSVWRSYAMGDYNTMVLTDFSCQGNNHREIYFAGGCGELLRGYWHKIIASAETESLATVIERVLQDKEPYLHKLHSPLKLEIIEYVSKQLEIFSQLNSWEALNRHYLFFRNRAHFGLQFHGYSTFQRAPTWMPLMSKSLLKSSYCFSFEERVTGRLIYEFIDANDEILANMGYDGGFPYAEEQRKNRDLFIPVISTVDKRAEWTATRNKVNAAIKSAGQGHSVSSLAAKTRLLHRSAAEALARLEILFPEYLELFAILRKSLGYKSLEFPRETAVLAAKIMALQDIFLPLKKYQENIPINNMDIDQHVTPFKTMSLSFAPEKITVDYELFEDVNPENYQFACYLLKGDTQQAVVWYGPQRKFEFNHPYEGQNVILFAKHKYGNVFRLETQPRPAQVVSNS